MYKFAPAWEKEQIVFGATRPGYTDKNVQDWIEFMKRQDIKRVCCLLDEQQLASYFDLLNIYKQEFGNQLICWAPIADFHLADLETLTQKILPFLIEADKQNEKVVVHCSGGIGRTGHVLAAWLVSVRGLSNQAAINAVKKTGRNPFEAVLAKLTVRVASRREGIAAIFRRRNPLTVVKELNALLNDCRLAANKTF
ncbi:dual specificity protein phosphatase family protein [Nostoc cf. edaphicum LEGE 07299]|uniref:Dual specificity protein phosphatase family protein n=1 Tax=Nostoc cf. edaphicum LEGE 07299 TaxID=2777974 RepID=A0ABR9U611_9NOSO|nr:dual specificity protein phosphatase family protein [Nostoc edaphicum]MBE9107522.1 dual specificity protein phosphatase family protein [Nostoc cf. edaphicum LEGE 07299]